MKDFGLYFVAHSSHMPDCFFVFGIPEIGVRRNDKGLLMSFFAGSYLRVQ